MTTSVNEPKKKESLHPFLPLIIMVILVAIATHFIPAGEFERTEVNGRTIVEQGSFQYVESNPTSISDFFQSFYYGFERGAGAMALIVFIGGTFGVLRKSGLLDLGVQGLTEKLKDKGIGVLALAVMTVIAINSGFTGMRELDMIFIMLLIPIMLKLGYDSMTALGIVLVGSAAGFAPAVANPFFTGIAHQIAELPIYSAIAYRGLITIVFLFTGLWYVTRYAKKVKKDPSLSLVADEEINFDASEHENSMEVQTMTPRLKAAGIAFLLLFGLMILGTLKFGFGFPQISGVFVAKTVIVGYIAGFNTNKICQAFLEGAQHVLGMVLIILFARSILVVLEDAMVIDTIIHNLSYLIMGTSKNVSALMIYVVQTIINVVVPSGSGQAMITMPIIIPLADMGGITRQVACLASQLGDGITNYLYPTNGILMGVLAASGISWGKWARFFLPLFFFWTITAGVFIVIAQTIELGPF